APKGELVVDRLRELDRLDDLGGRPPPTRAHGRPTSRQAPGAPAVRPQTFGHGSARQPGKLTESSHSKLTQLAGSLSLERKELERQRAEELGSPLVRYDERLTRPRDARGSKGGEAPLGGAGPRLPARADGGQGALERPPQPAAEPPDPAGRGVDAARLGRVVGGPPVR